MLKKLFQTNNCVKVNKDQHLFVFLCLLMAKEVFEEVQFSFLIVHHAHENIAKIFDHLLSKLRKKKNCVCQLDERVHHFF
jgi:hypothetical protein